MGYIFSDSEMKGRLIRHEDDWFVGEWKPNDQNSQWIWWICGTREWLGLTDQEFAWAVDKRVAVK
jgi:hypothetical protein